jgi:hypothetical protein
MSNTRSLIYKGALQTVFTRQEMRGSNRATSCWGACVVYHPQRDMGSAPIAPSLQPFAVTGLQNISQKVVRFSKGTQHATLLYIGMFYVEQHKLHTTARVLGCL